MAQRRKVASLLAALLGVATAGCARRIVQCHLIGCHSGYFRKYQLPDEAHALKQLSVEVCRNGHCLTGTLSPPPKVGRGNSAWLGGTEAEIAVVTVPSGYEAGVSYYGRELRDGDRYDITVRDEQGRQLAATHESVRYVAHQPNGPSCPPTCMVAPATP
jgi:hypothetical protein